MAGGYEDGYQAVPCLWGEGPGSLVKIALESGFDPVGANVLDVGAGEGKNAVHLADLGADVLAIEVSSTARQNGVTQFGGIPKSVTWRTADVRESKLGEGVFDMAIAYGLTHCMANRDEVFELVEKIQISVRPGGLFVLCAFNDRHQDLTAHPGFEPTLVPHDEYLGSFAGWRLEHATDEDLQESHPHNRIPHVHSMTRIIARKASD
ncbi:MAG: methyltransferase domain-containing protein [Solirubrobacterales bacterium]